MEKKMKTLRQRRTQGAWSTFAHQKHPFFKTLYFHLLEYYWDRLILPEQDIAICQEIVVITKQRDGVYPVNGSLSHMVSSVGHILTMWGSPDKKKTLLRKIHLVERLQVLSNSPDLHPLLKPQVIFTKQRWVKETEFILLNTYLLLTRYSTNPPTNILS